MHVSFFFIIAIAVALIVGPLMMMRPSPAQKNRENLRAMARARGLHFSVRNLPRQASEQEKPAPISVYFFAPENNNNEKDWMLVRTNFQHEIHFLNEWQWQNNSQASAAEKTVLREFLPIFPESIKAVSAGGQGLCVYWDEVGGEEILQKIIGLLEALRALQVKK